MAQKGFTSDIMTAVSVRDARSDISGLVSTDEGL